MGRRDAVQVTLEVIAEMRRMEPRLLVTYEPGWETRGNGTSANYEGALVHHTATPSSLAKPFPTQKLLRDGRTDLSGPLCNEAGPACTVDAPRIHVMAANPANHAGASGGKSMGPLPVTSLFNPRVRGLEIDYAGTVAMLAGQLHVARLWARANAVVVGGGDVNRIRAHFETSVTGKVDIGYAPGKTYDMAAFRRDAAALTVQEDDMFTDDDRKALDWLVDAVNGVKYRHDNRISPLADNLKATPGTALGRAVGAAEYAATAADGKAAPDGRKSPLANLLTGGKVDGQLAEGMQGGGVLAGAAAPVSDDQLARVLVRPDVAGAFAEALANVLNRQARDGDPATGPVS